MAPLKKIDGSIHSMFMTNLISFNCYVCELKTEKLQEG